MLFKHHMPLFAVICLLAVQVSVAQTATPTPVFQFNSNSLSTRWSSPENLNGAKGAGGKADHGAKGHASDAIAADSTKTLLDVQGTGVINRIWITIGDRSPAMLRGLKLEIFWDGETKPAVSVPFGDFFSVGLGKTATFQNNFFASPEGRSFICYIPMPFKKAAKIVVVNESGKMLWNIFFDVDFQYLKSWDDNNLYFHAYWHRDTATTIGKDFELLPSINGKGRYLGANIGINANPIYRDSWWGEGEVKMYIDGDNSLPTLVGTGTEDYIGTGWGQSAFATNYSGCLVANDSLKQWAYYRFHVPDPIYFANACKVTLQQIGGNEGPKVIALQKASVPLTPTMMYNDANFKNGKPGQAPLKPEQATGWTNFYRSDDVSSTVYFYLNTPTDELPALQGVAMRTYKLK